MRRLVDVRLNNVSQLAGFTKKRDLAYFLRSIADIAYVHEPSLAPTKDILDAYKKKRIDWSRVRMPVQAAFAVAPPAGTIGVKRLRSTHACSAASRRPSTVIADWSRNTFGSNGKT